MINKLIKKVGTLILAPVILSSALAFGEPNKSHDEEISGKQTIETLVESPAEINVEQIINDKFEQYFSTYSIGENNITLNMPFGEDGERSTKTNYNQRFYYGGKGNPADLWGIIDKTVESSRFKEYISELEKEGEKVVIFDLKKQKYDVSRNKSLISKMKNGRYPGNDTLIYVYKKSGSFEKEDVYNFLYCLCQVGTDCSGFVYNIQREIALRKGINLDNLLAEKLGVNSNKLPIYIGTWLYDSEQDYIESVEDNIINIKPGDIILFRGKEGKIRHSAVIQSIDKNNGIIRYMQSTDWAPKEERGVHESLIIFNPENPNISLKDKSLIWKQRIISTFKGEPAIGWRNDGERYRAYQNYGGGKIVRLKLE